jgi:probable F420-dependent oxidoreductase
MQRYGMTIPIEGVPLREQRPWIEELEALGYTDLWSSEATTGDGFTPLALAGEWASSVRLGPAIIPAFTRTPACLAMQVATMADAFPGRFVFGIGTSSNVIVEQWNGVPFEKPYQRVRDMVRFLKQALAGEKISQRYETFHVEGFRLGRMPQQKPKIMIAALREGMLRLAGRESDGAILNWLSAEDVKRVAPYVHAGGPGKELVARIFVVPSENRAVARQVARRMITAYLNVPVYAKFHEWLGRGPKLRSMWEHWAAGDRKAATEAIPDEVVDELVIHGDPGECRAHVQRYVDCGITCPVLAVTPVKDIRVATRELAPR